MSTSTAAPRRITLRIYTYAHRLPQTIGKLPGGVNLPWVVGLQQFVVFFATLWLLFQSRRAWAHFGTVPDALIMLVLPAVLAWLARAAKMQGRGLVRGLMGLAVLVTATATGHSSVSARGTRRPGTRTRLTGRLLTEPALELNPGPAQATDVVGAEPVRPAIPTAVTPMVSAVTHPVRAIHAAAAAPVDEALTQPLAPPVTAVQTATAATPQLDQPVEQPASQPVAQPVVAPGMPGGRAANRYALFELVDAARVLRANQNPARPEDSDTDRPAQIDPAARIPA